MENPSQAQARVIHPDHTHIKSQKNNPQRRARVKV